MFSLENSWLFLVKQFWFEVNASRAAPYLHSQMELCCSAAMNSEGLEKASEPRSIHRETGLTAQDGAAA
jgi:hypothetical protein